MSEEVKRILVVDDNRSLVRLLEGVLLRAGYDVLTAFDGQEGLRVVRQEKPDLVILDIVMPNMDGYQVCRELQNDPDTASIPVILLTVKGQVDDTSIGETDVNTGVRERLAGFEVGAMDFISKPVKAADLLDRVRNLLWLSTV
ncbi:MAG TPA: response regulator [Anaerolineae bacterium]